MQLSSDQVALIKQSWRTLRNVSPAVVGDLFYSKLFVDHPSLRKLFPGDMKEQYTKLTDMLNAMVMQLDNIKLFTAEIAAMARRHTGYGVKPAHYKSVGEALLWTLQKGSGDAWNAELQKAWSSCYWNLAHFMMNAAQANHQ